MSERSYQTRFEDGAAFINAGAGVDMDRGRFLLQTVDRLVTKDVRRVVVDFSGMQQLNLSLFGSLARQRDRLRQQGGDLVLTAIPEAVRWRLQDLGMLERFALAPHADMVRLAGSNRWMSSMPDN